METKLVKAWNEETFEPWTILIVAKEGRKDQFFVESRNLNKAYDDFYFALREMLYADLLTPRQHQDAVLALMEDYERMTDA